YMQTLETPLTF
nr:immunoglobulin light chain junction region [Macaca mulatta]